MSKAHGAAGTTAMQARALGMGRRRLAVLLLSCVGACFGTAPPALAAVRFAVLGNLPAGAANEAAGRTMLAALAGAPVEFVLDTGNLKLASEPCSDALLRSRVDLLNSSPRPLILIPGANDWVTCQRPEAGGYDPLERLDFLREQFFEGSQSLGQKPLALTRESNVTRFRQFRENIEWQVGPVLFVGLNVSSDGNHFLAGGGRNGEFEDRAVANRYWLEHALRVTQRRRTEAVVIVIQGDPGWAAPVRRRAFAWLDFGAATPHDPYLDFKHDLLKFAQQFNGPVLLIHQADLAARQSGEPVKAVAHGTPAFVLETPEHHKKAIPANRIWQLQIDAQADPRRWVGVEILTGREPVFKASVHDVPATLPINPPAMGTASALVPNPDTDDASGVTAPQLLPLPPVTVPSLLEDDAPSQAAPRQ